MCTPEQMQAAIDVLKAHHETIPCEFSSLCYRTVLSEVSNALANILARATGGDATDDVDWHAVLLYELDVYTVSKVMNDSFCVKTDAVLTQAMSLIAAYFNPDNTVEEDIIPIAVH